MTEVIFLRFILVCELRMGFMNSVIGTVNQASEEMNATLVLFHISHSSASLATVVTHSQSVFGLIFFFPPFGPWRCIKENPKIAAIIFSGFEIVVLKL